MPSSTKEYDQDDDEYDKVGISSMGNGKGMGGTPITVLVEREVV